MEDYDSYDGSGLELFHLSDVLDYIGEENNNLKIKKSWNFATTTQLQQVVLQRYDFVYVNFPRV